jgi:tRNA-dihydrouridine synthase B
MDGYCDSAFRATCRSVAPDIVVFSEFYSADGLHHNPLLAKRVLTHDPIEHPLVFQIFGNTPEIFLSAGKIIESYGAQGVDINMGCPAKKVVKCWYGSGLMIDRDRAMKIVNILAENLKIPVSVKTRLGWSDASELVEFGKCLEQAGASLISVHGRTYQQEYTWSANWEPMFELQRALKIPVVWNGDCKNYENWIVRIQNTGDMPNLWGFMIARHALGNPWCFLPWDYVPTWQERISVMHEHMRRMVDSKWENRACIEIRKHFTHYLHGFEGVREYRKKLAMVTSVSETENILWELSKMDIPLEVSK